MAMDTVTYMPEYILLHCSEHIFFSTKCNLNLNQNNKTSVSNFIQKSSECEISKQVPNIHVAHFNRVCPNFMERPIYILYMTV